MEEGHQTVEVAGRRKEEKEEEEDGSGRLSEEELSQVAHMPDFLRNMQVSTVPCQWSPLPSWGVQKGNTHLQCFQFHDKERQSGVLGWMWCIWFRDMAELTGACRALFEE
jgi:hypothetical protein